MTVVYGPLTIGDADRCAALEAELFPGDDPWPAVAFIRELESGHNHYVSARVDGELVGYAGVSRLGRKPPFEYEVHTIGVDERFQGRGIGRTLLDQLLAIADGETSSSRCARTTRRRSACTRASASPCLASASGITGSAVPTPTRCVEQRGKRHDDRLGHRKFL